MMRVATHFIEGCAVPSELTIVAANIMQSAIPVLSLVAYLPQWKQLIRTKSSRDISLSSWLIWSVSAIFALVYAIVQYRVTGAGSALVFSSATILLFVLITVVLVAMYRDDSRRRLQPQV